MAEIKAIKISGFRGINSYLPLNFEKGNSVRSMVIYGRNGTGKSSITDAWEWFHTEKIEHLRREGAGPSSYPNINAQAGKTFVEIIFSNKELGTIRLSYDNTRITKPIINGPIVKFRSLAPHPCHIRFEDLTRFVYLTKAEKFDALAQLMGFMPQVEMQKAFRRVSRNFLEIVDDKKKECNSTKDRLKKITLVDDITNEKFLENMNKCLERHGIAPAISIDDLRAKQSKLNNLVVNDPRTTRVNLLETVSLMLKKPSITEREFLPLLDDYIASIHSLLNDEKEVSKLLLLDLYEQGEKVLSQLGEHGEKIFSKTLLAGNTVDVCPLCGQTYDGDLSSHISVELKGLRKLKQARDDIEKKRKNTQSKLPQQNNFSVCFAQYENKLDELDESFALRLSEQTVSLIENEISSIRRTLNQRVDHVNQASLMELIGHVNSIKDHLASFDEQRLNLINKMDSELSNADPEDKTRIKLVEDNNKFSQAIDLWYELSTIETHLEFLQQVSLNFIDIVEDYVKKSIENVESRFATISQDVKTYFEILEQDTKGLTGAVLKLLPEDDRAVELQIDFHGEAIYPAYKYLSESQLNSFGLSIFLASTKYFNANFKFIILDDIINSFDGYKRPRIIQLLKQEFDNHQILLLTHDNVWCDRLFEAFPLSVKKRFTRWEFNHGPFELDGSTPIEKIQQYIDDDEPVEAGRNMGPYLERQLQDLGENFEILVKYNRLNEYTLAPLLERFMARVKEKLGSNHPLYIAASNLNAESGFRNLCAHWKNPAIQLTKEEMKQVMEKWLEIEKLARCKDNSCLEWAAYESVSSTFVCPCGKTRLRKTK
jgi:hypothetical protein